jgi:vacuolar-type H+-ATPase subunit I/STV1
MSVDEAEARAEGRREAAPAALLALGVFFGLAVVSWSQGWSLLGLHWWIWLLVAAPSLLLTIDLTMSYSGAGLVRSRSAALVLLALLVLGNVIALTVLVAGLVTTNTADLGGGELLLTGFAIWSANVIVFGLSFWEVEAGGPVARLRLPSRATRDFQFPQDDLSRTDARVWRPQVWDYLYVSLTNSIAFSPTDTLPLTLRAKAMMGFESAISAVTVLLVAARAVNVLGS